MGPEKSYFNILNTVMRKKNWISSYFGLEQTFLSKNNFKSDGKRAFRLFNLICPLRGGRNLNCRCC